MSEAHIPDPNELTRQPRAPSAGGDTPQVSAEDALEEMKERLAAETASRQAAERRAGEESARRAAAETKVTEATGTVLSAHERSIEAGIAAQTSASERAKAAMVAAYGAGDPVAIADAQEAMADAKAQLAALNHQKSWLTAEKQRQEAEAKRPPQSQNGAVRVSTPGGDLEVSPRDKEWMDEHPRFYSDPNYYNHAIATHNTLVAQGAHPGSAIYYKGLTDGLSRYEAFEAHERGDTMNDNLSQRQQQRRAPASSVAAPVSRATTPRQPSNGVMNEQQIAQHIGAGVTPADLREYARINGYRGEEGYQRYLAAQTEVIQLERSGQETGLKTDAMYR